MKALVFTSLLISSLTAAAASKISVELDKPGHAVSPTLWGVFFEDINLSADGGIYPELVRNRSFEDAGEPEFWRLTAKAGNSEMTIDSSRALNSANPHCLRVKVDGSAQIENEGYWGMNIVKGESYELKLAGRNEGLNQPLEARIVSSSGAELARTSINGLNGDWKYYTAKLTAAGSDPKARLQIRAAGTGTLFLDMVSLMPEKTWKEHGLRPDLAESLAALKPSFMRFPGGCWVEGEDRAHMYNWKRTIGDVDQRVPLWNIWKYNATHGLGFHEYLQLCEDLGATPLWDINCGMSHRETAPMNEMDRWVQDALDSIEYANGPTNSRWGALRGQHGHPEPFNLRFMEIGNENGGPAYRDRWPLFVKAIKAKYPEIQLVANHWLGGYPKDPMPDIVDEHYYNTPEFFMRQAHRYDNYDRKGPKIFIGEYACTRNIGRGNLRGAIGEAAFMTGIERNSDVVVMASYAPLLVNLNHRAWNPDLINFDSSRWYGLPSYYVQKLFSENRGDVTLPTIVEAAEIDEPLPSGCIGVGTWNTAAEFKDVKVTAPDGKVLFASDFSKDGVGGPSPWKTLGDGKWSVRDGALQQTAEREFVRALVGDKSWTDYTLELKARKLSGREGFLILFHIQNDDDRIWWNIAGWNNTQHAIELGETLDGKEGRVETGRWYDVRLELKGQRIKCWLDDRLMHDYEGTSNPTRIVYASATRDEKNNDLILKVVNTAATPTEVELNLNGAAKLAGPAQAVVLSSDSPRDENSIDEPTKVSPKTTTLNPDGPKFTHAFPGNSLTVLRIATAK
jgi:alpha-L-arabinofuranosidase